MRAQLYSIQELPTGQVSIMALREAGVDVLASFLTPEEVIELDLREE